ncbi:hypothetical protein SPBRAN_1942 [uncultured Candidatus Thioglobus sp.]|nr:hypothetical protein SPBRAN_1942 [uncultured Candidatus Thioglobus sp.]
MQNKQMKFDSLDKEEQAIVKAVENQEFSKIGEIEGQVNDWQASVKETIERKSIHLKLQARDVQKIRAIAYEKGIPYQTLIGSILHQYAKNAEKKTIPL